MMEDRPVAMRAGASTALVHHHFDPEELPESADTLRAGCLGPFGRSSTRGQAIGRLKA